MLNSNTQAPTLDRYLRQRQLIQGGYVPFSHATLWRRVADGTFPQPVKLSVGVTAWRERDVLQWQQQNLEAAAT